MLRKTINNLSNYAGHTEVSFWEQVSSENIDFFLMEYTLPQVISKFSTDDYDLLKKMIKEEVIKEDDNGHSLLGAVEVDIVSDILILNYLYGTLVAS